MLRKWVIKSFVNAHKMVFVNAHKMPYANAHKMLFPNALKMGHESASTLSLQIDGNMQMRFYCYLLPRPRQYRF